MMPSDTIWQDQDFNMILICFFVHCLSTSLTVASVTTFKATASKSQGSWLEMFMLNEIFSVVIFTEEQPLSQLCIETFRVCFGLKGRRTRLTHFSLRKNCGHCTCGLRFFFATLRCTKNIENADWKGFRGNYYKGFFLPRFEFKMKFPTIHHHHASSHPASYIRLL